MPQTQNLTAGYTSLTKINTGLAQKAQLYLNSNAYWVASARAIPY